MKSIDCLNYESADGYKVFDRLFDDLSEHVGVLSAEEASSLSAYMCIFEAPLEWLSYPRDPLEPDSFIEKKGGDDGTFLWSGMTHHLIERHRVDPPMAFRMHVAEQMQLGMDLSEKKRLLNKVTRGISSRERRLRAWRRLKAEGNASDAWALYP